jgi:hypothetical protein
VVHGDCELSGRRLRQTPACVGLGLFGQLDLLLARGAHPAGEPLRRQAGVGGAEAPGTGPHEDLGPRSPEPLNGDCYGIRAEQSSALGHAALVGIERGGHPAVQWTRRGQVDATNDGQREQHGTPRAGADRDQPGQLVPGQQVQQRRGGDQVCAAQIARAQSRDVGQPRVDRDRGEVDGGDFQQVGVPVV